MAVTAGLIGGTDIGAVTDDADQPADEEKPGRPPGFF
jgi:hypothetical protein